MPDADGRISRRCNRSPGLGANGMMQSQPMCRPRIERHYASSELLKNEQPTRKESRLRGIVAPRTRDSSMGAGGADRIRTDDPLLAKQMLSQLSYSPAARNLRLRVRCRVPRSPDAGSNRGGSGWS